MIRIAIIAALPGELAPFVRGWQKASANGVDLWRRRGNREECIGACAGIGVDAAARSFEQVLSGGSIDHVFSVGWAGALRPDIAPGRAYTVCGVIDGETGDRFSAAEETGVGWLVTINRIANVAEKRRLARDFGAALVDMEAVRIARLAVEHRIPFSCIKGVTDGAADQLPDFNRFIAKNGKLLLARFISAAVRRPREWPALIRLGLCSTRAARGIGQSLQQAVNFPEGRHLAAPLPSSGNKCVGKRT